jgi:hypothetical protein
MLVVEAKSSANPASTMLGNESLSRAVAIIPQSESSMLPNPFDQRSIKPTMAGHDQHRFLFSFAWTLGCGMVYQRQ